MKRGPDVFSFGKKGNEIEWKLLVFLVLMMNVKLVVKLAAIVFIFFLQPNFKFGFRWHNTRLPLFYLSVIAIAVINFIIGRNFSQHYSLVVLTGILFWTVSILAIHQVKLLVDRSAILVLHNTLLVFFVINIILSFLNLSAILFEIGWRNPFQYQGQYQKYFLNTGDYIKGVSFDTSTTNAAINCFAIVYFLYRQKYGLVLAAMIVLLMTASNYSILVMLIIFAGMFLFNSRKEQKSIIAVCILFLAIFFAKLSPQNDSYVLETVNNFLIKKRRPFIAPEKIIPIRDRPDSLLTPETRKEQIAILYLDSIERERLKRIPFAEQKRTQTRPALPHDSIHTASYQWKRDTTAFQRQLIAYLNNRPLNDTVVFEKEVTGKMLSYKQSYQFLKSHPAKILLGDGTGNFSSKLAFRATGLQMAGGFPANFTYSNPDFLNNHLRLYAHFFSQNAESHSIIHNPDSTYDQLLTEYGLIGLIAFPALYIGFFVKQLKKLSDGLPILVSLLFFLLVNYSFEQLSVVVLFELIMFINIKEQHQISSHE